LVRRADAVPLTAADWLAVLEPKLTEPLFDPETVGRLHRLAKTLPGECQATLEVRLAPGAAPIDLSLRLRAPEQASAMAARLPSSSIRKFLSRWSEVGGPLAPVRSVWLEFDLDQEAPSPVVCAKLPADADSGWLIGTLLPALQGDSLSAGQSDLILACLGALPDSARLLYVFSLRARGTEAVRLEIFGMEPSLMLAYLQSVASGMVPAVTDITPLFEGVERLHLSLDVAEEVLPRIGIEGSFPRQPGREPRWKELFGRLELHGLCSSGKREAALAWPGYDSFWTAPEQWPIAGIEPEGFCVRALSHVKVVCRPDCEPEAKAYLVFGPLDRSSDAAPASSAARRSVFST
jgi:hypothetical protein